MHLSHVPQNAVQNRDVRISGLNRVSWDMGQVQCVICEIGLLCDRWRFAMIISALVVFIKHLSGFFQWHTGKVSVTKFIVM